MSKHLVLFDSHFHIIDPDYPMVPNKGYLPEAFTCDQYLQDTADYQLVGGAVVSGSFQAFDQTYLIAALGRLGPGFVGVTQLSNDASDEEITSLHASGVRAIRFNLYRGDSDQLDYMASMASRVYELVGWHIELYVDSSQLAPIASTLLQLPAVSIDHLGLRREGFSELLRLAEKGVRVKATGFGRTDLDIGEALKTLNLANPDALMFGTDLPGTRAPVPFQASDIDLIIDSLGLDAAEKVLRSNAVAFYKLDLPDNAQ
ncbi:MAG: amidohydrolase family protein [Pseudomonadota bacterium]